MAVAAIQVEVEKENMRQAVLMGTAAVTEMLIQNSRADDGQ